MAIKDAEPNSFKTFDEAQVYCLRQNQMIGKPHKIVCPRIIDLYGNSDPNGEFVVEKIPDEMFDKNGIIL